MERKIHLKQCPTKADNLPMGIAALALIGSEKATMQDMIRTTTKWSLIFTWILVGLWVTGCDRPLFMNDLEAIKARGELVFITRNNTICYYEGPQGPTGFEYDLVKEFADHLGVEARPLVIEDEADMIAALRKLDFTRFAGYYNGSGQQQQYGQWIDDHYQAFKTLAANINE